MKNKFAVFGNPIRQSLSPQIHQQFASQHALTISYERVLSDNTGFTSDINEFFKNGGTGCNITAPFKEPAYEMCAELTEHAKRAQAVNTLYKNDSDQLCGHNTDGGGLLRDLTTNLGLSLKDSHIIVLGAGGATRGILQPLIDQWPARITIINRTLAKAQTLANEFGDVFSIEAVAADSIPTDLPAADLLLNATSASLEAKLPVTNSAIISDNTFCYDLSYASEPTRFLQWTKECGCRHNHDGRGMLVEQAALAFTSWHKLEVSTKTLINNFEDLKAQ